VVGLIQKLLLDFVEAKAGPEAVAEVKRRAGVAEGKRFRLDTVYADDEWQRLLNAACEVLGVSREQAEEAYAEFFGEDAFRRWPKWFEISKDARSFLARQPIIHNFFATALQDPEARKAVNDKFQLEQDERGITTRYRSPNGHCGLYKALARWVLKRYGEAAEITEPRCTRRGDAECEIRIDWPAAGGAR
jgi:hypothetical protein